MTDDPENPELTDLQLSQLKPFAEALPGLAKNMKRGRPKSANPKVAVSLRLDKEVLDKFKSTGDGWQTRMNDALKQAKV